MCIDQLFLSYQLYTITGLLKNSHGYYLSLVRQFSLELKYFKFSWMFIETKVDILHQQVTKEKQYIYTAESEKIQPQFGFKYFEASKLSSCFLRWTYLLHCIRQYLEKEKGGEMCRPERDVTLDIAVNVIPCLSMFPISIITFCRVIPQDL